MKISIWFISALLMVGSTPKVHAWDDFGHMQIAAVAYDQLTEVTKARVAQLLQLNPSYASWIAGSKPNDVNRTAFVRAATWADAIKFDRDYTRDKIDAATATQNIGYSDHFVHDFWHYIDEPFSGDGTKTAPTPVPNAQTQVAGFRAVLSKHGSSDDVKSYDLAWLLHLVGDLHQPLHCISRFTKEQATVEGDRGGNLVKITGARPIPVCNDSRYCPYGPPTNLHAFIDIITGDSYSLADVYAAARALPRPSKKEIAIGDEASWIAEGVELAKSHVYAAPIGVGAGPYSIDETYQRAMLVLGRKRISLAGQRLAHLLNEAFALEAKAVTSAAAASGKPAPAAATASQISNR